MKKFILKVLTLLILFIAIMKYIDLSDYVVYDKKDGKNKILEVQNKNKDQFQKIRQIGSKVITKN